MSNDTDDNAGPDRIVTLDVGGRHFKTTQKTLVTESPFFKDLLSDGSGNTSRQDDGSYFVDTDPDIFNHILTYLRYGIFPTLKQGSPSTYAAIQAEAANFEIARLAAWLADKVNEVTIQIAGRQFKASKTELISRSGFFENLLSEFCVTDAPIPIADADPDLFVHILRYVHTQKFPQFQDSQGTFDQIRYNRLRIEAHRFQMKELSEWIKTGRFDITNLTDWLNAKWLATKEQE